ncbi:hypothetical protein BIY27_10705 [Gibbsiella quercinecans]|uniref:type II toxin-antitoxin system Phd/YefM family antitoxin n=1 Tax=Gibbsiella quercinecans TaxID=929813 RepID=UPI000EF24EE2|nr:type II toxin-antitoxin system Phd/YefM family antitoxin [Gibbsiella quercinecans]RLM13383.1 hypothetical protein BIY27_10705 [Gibbsiella quercinecans]
MKTITYTQMRSDLSATLELLRSGESLTVTQRGKPDLVINATVVSRPIFSNEIAHTKQSVEFVRENKSVNNAIARLIESNMSPQLKEGLMNATKQLDNLLSSEETRKAMLKLANSAIALQGVSESFAKALKHTQIKHADIIKKLEDK